MFRRRLQRTVPTSIRVVRWAEEAETGSKDTPAFRFGMGNRWFRFGMGNRWFRQVSR